MSAETPKPCRSPLGKARGPSSPAAALSAVVELRRFFPGVTDKPTGTGMRAHHCRLEARPARSHANQKASQVMSHTLIPKKII